MKRFLVVVASMLAAFVLSSTPALADPSFGPGAGNGDGNNEPGDAGAKCHPPGQTVEVPGCK